MLENNNVYEGDCLRCMEYINDNTIDMVFADLPYGKTANKWDTIIDLNEWWPKILRVLKPNGVVVMTGSQPFTTSLINSNRKMFKYELIWEKTMATGFLQAKSRPLRAHENIIIFGGKTYNPQLTKGKPYKDNNHKKTSLGNWHDITNPFHTTINKGTRQPRSVIKISNPNNNLIHPTQKPVELLEWLIKTYTNEGDVVLDPVSGSGTTAVACINTNRNYICIEQNHDYWVKSNERIVAHQSNNSSHTFSL
jgi:site-specific DNA-methyltransferase (adenine-specific)